MNGSIEIAQDLGHRIFYVTCGLVCLSLVLLVVELVTTRGTGRRSARIAVTGVLGVASLFFAVVRPTRVIADGARVGPRVVVLVDASRSIDLPANEGTRRNVAARSSPSSESARKMPASSGERSQKALPLRWRRKPRRMGFVCRLPPIAISRPPSMQSHRRVTSTRARSSSSPMAVSIDLSKQATAT